MIKCRSDEKPCCDYCKYCEHAIVETPIFAPDEPMYCNLHKDHKHMMIVPDCGYCDDFHCIHAR